MSYACNAQNGNLPERGRRALSGGADNRCKDFPDNDGMLKVLWTRVAGTAAVARNGEAAL